MTTVCMQVRLVFQYKFGPFSRDVPLDLGRFGHFHVRANNYLIQV